MAVEPKYRHYIMNSNNAENFNLNYLEWIKKRIIRNIGKKNSR